MYEQILAIVKFDDRGLVPVVVQDTVGTVLMLAYVNEEALLKTLQTGVMHYYSRSRQRLWIKGETSGNTQTLQELRVDCDGDALLCIVEQKGAACHEGYYTCFFRRVSGESPVTIARRLFDPAQVYKDA